MNQKELIDLTVLLLEAGRIGTADLARYVQLFNTGHLTADMLPMSVTDMPGVITTIEAAQAQAAVVARLTPTSASDYFKLAGSPVTTKTPPAVQKWLRVRTRDHFRGEFDRTVVRMGRQAAQSGDVRAWQGNMQKELRAYYIRQHTAGVGRPPTKAEIDRLSILAVQQQAYLQRFAAEVSARQALGNPMSGDAIGSRSVLYGGPGWEEWHRGNESAEIRGDAVDMIVHYRAVDDGSTCSSCLEAANNGPYLVGKHPWPGSGTCEAFGRCRCRLEYEHNPEEWKRLSLADPSPPPPTPPTEEKPAKPVVSDAVKAKRAATRKAKAAALKAAAAKETSAAPAEVATPAPAVPSAVERVAGQELSLRRDLPDLIERTAKNEEFAFGPAAPDTDLFLDAIVKKQGYDGPAEVVTQARGDALLEEGDIRLYRGVRNQGGRTATTNAFVTQYKDGDFFIGYGIYGNGAYATDVIRTAHEYAGDPSETSPRDIIQLNLRSDARTIGYEELRTRIKAYKNELNEEYAEQLIDARNSSNPTANVARIEAEREASVELTNDPGRTAAYLGYDVIINDFRVGDKRAEAYYVILNRTATRYVEWD